MITVFRFEDTISRKSSDFVRQFGCLVKTVFRLRRYVRLDGQVVRSRPKSELDSHQTNKWLAFGRGILRRDGSSKSSDALSTEDKATVKRGEDRVEKKI